MKHYGLWDSKVGWAKSEGRRLVFWGIERARAAWLEWMTAQAQLGADWQIRGV
jgi:hypothetical protein